MQRVAAVGPGCLSAGFQLLQRVGPDRLQLTETDFPLGPRNRGHGSARAGRPGHLVAGRAQFTGGETGTSSAPRFHHLEQLSFDQGTQPLHQVWRERMACANSLGAFAVRAERANRASSGEGTAAGEHC